MWLCVKFYGHPKLNFLMCLMHFGEWGKKRLKKFDKGWIFLWKVWFWKSFEVTNIHVISQKQFFKWFCRKKKKNFPEFFKIYVPLEFDRLSLFFDWSKCEDEKHVFDLKSQVHWIPSWFLLTSRTFLHVHFDFCPIPFDRSDFRFQKHIGIRSDFWKVFFCLSLWYLSRSLLSKKKKNCHFSWSKYQRFSS